MDYSYNALNSALTTMSDNLKPFILILGMHRSGTSCLAGCLERSGLNLGTVRRSGRFNTKGYYEIKALERLHNQVLGLNGGTWHEPPARHITIHPHHHQEMMEELKTLSKRRPCGVKDPRLLLLLDRWLEVVPPPFKLIGTYRHPMSVAKSLAARNGLSEEKSIRLWLHYNNALMERHKQNPFPLLEFDLTDIDQYCKTVATLAVKLGLKPRQTHLFHFISQKLDHYPNKTMVPSACREIYNYLQFHRVQASESLPQPKRFHKLLGAVQEITFRAINKG